MKRRRFRQRVPRVVMRLVGAFEASFRQIFGSFLNVEGFCGVFIPGSRGFVLFTKREFSFERLSFPCVFR